MHINPRKDKKSKNVRFDEKADAVFLKSENPSKRRTAFFKRPAEVSMLAAALLVVSLICDAFGAGSLGLPSITQYSYAETAETANFTTEYFNSDIKVGEDNSYTITEVIGVTFTEPCHYIYRSVATEGQEFSDYNGEEMLHYIRMKMDQVNVLCYSTEEADSKDANSEGADGSAVSAVASACDFEYYTESSGDIQSTIIKIGDGDSYMSGQMTYIITYRLRVYDDRIDEYDKVYLNIIPQSWPTAIDAGYVRISMPAQFPLQDEAELRAGSYDDSEQMSIAETSQADGSEEFYCEFSNLEAGKGLTFQAILPEGYFSGELNTNWAVLAMIAAMAAALLLAFLMWLLLGRDPKVAQKVEFYPPEDVGPEEVGYIVDGKVDKVDLAALFVHFANKGYISIKEEKPEPQGFFGKFGIGEKNPESEEKAVPQETAGKSNIDEKESEKEEKARTQLALEETGTNEKELRKKQKSRTKGIFGKFGIGEKKSSFVIEKLSDIPAEAPIWQKTFFAGLFGSGETVRLDELDGDFGEAYIKAMEQLKDSFENDKSRRVFTKSSVVAQVICAVLMIIPLLALCVFGKIWLNSDAIPYIFVFALLLFPGGIISMKAFAHKYSLTRSRYIMKRIIGGLLIFISLAGSGALGVMMLSKLAGKPASLLAVLAVICSLACYKFAMIMTKRTKYGAKMLGKIMGLREFMGTAEKDRLEKLEKMDPKYFYEVLPYAHVLGLTEKWIKAFEGVEVAPPAWYDCSGGDTGFDVWTMNDVMKSCNAAASAAALDGINSESVDGGNGGASGEASED